jgi:hypothetical protein
MAKKKETIGMVIELPKAERQLLKRHMINLEDAGVTKSKVQIATDIFILGLHNSINNLPHEAK